jgi:hypothetical protein
MIGHPSGVTGRNPTKTFNHETKVQAASTGAERTARSITSRTPAVVGRRSSPEPGSTVPEAIT